MVTLGSRVYLFETDDALVATRQIEVYDDGTRLLYDQTSVEDAFGQLAIGPVFSAAEPVDRFEIDRESFEVEWGLGRRVPGGS